MINLLERIENSSESNFENLLVHVVYVKQFPVLHTTRVRTEWREKVQSSRTYSNISQKQWNPLA